MSEPRTQPAMSRKRSRDFEPSPDPLDPRHSRMKWIYPNRWFENWVLPTVQKEEYDEDWQCSCTIQNVAMSCYYQGSVQCAPIDPNGRLRVLLTQRYFDTREEAQSWRYRTLDLQCSMLIWERVRANMEVCVLDWLDMANPEPQHEKIRPYVQVCILAYPVNARNLHVRFLTEEEMDVA